MSENTGMKRRDFIVGGAVAGSITAVGAIPTMAKDGAPTTDISNVIYALREKMEHIECCMRSLDGMPDCKPPVSAYHSYLIEDEIKELVRREWRSIKSAAMTRHRKRADELSAAIKRLAGTV